MISNNNKRFLDEMDSVWSSRKDGDVLSNFTWSKKAELESLIKSIPRHGSTIYVHPLDMLQTIPPSQLITNMLDTEMVHDHICVRDFDGSSSSMESTGLLHLIKEFYWNSNGKIVLGTIIIDDDTTMKKVISHPYTLPRGQINKGGLLPVQIIIPVWFCDPNYRSKCVGNMVFELVSRTKELTKLDALRLKKYYQYYIKQNRGKGLQYLQEKR